jgi:hypothetical protein
VCLFLILVSTLFLKPQFQCCFHAIIKDGLFSAETSKCFLGATDVLTDNVELGVKNSLNNRTLALIGLNLRIEKYISIQR